MACPDCRAGSRPGAGALGRRVGSGCQQRQTGFPDCGSTRGPPTRPAQGLAPSGMRSHATPRFWRLFRGLPAEVRRLAVKAYHLWQENPSHPSLRYRRLEGRENLVTVRGEHYRALDLLEAGVVEWIWIGAHARRGAPSVPRYVPETGRTSSTSPLAFDRHGCDWNFQVSLVDGNQRCHRGAVGRGRQFQRDPPDRPTGVDSAFPSALRFLRQRAARWRHIHIRFANPGELIGLASALEAVPDKLLGLRARSTVMPSS